uniref:Kallikrein related peptidase 9 n=2 Tax=Ornithorhynchus anatinus TaxID=9258 RepID=A0A6I8NSI9_ORNAN
MEGGQRKGKTLVESRLPTFRAPCALPTSAPRLTSSSLPQTPITMTLWTLLLLFLAAGARADMRTIGGAECPPGSQPWQAGLFFLTRLFCGATLLSDRWLLTAAHCRKPYLWVRLGEHNLFQWEGPERLIRVTRFFPHPRFNSNLSAHDHNHDVMLVRLPRPVRLSPSIQPIQLASSCPDPGTLCLVSGWGAFASPKAQYPDSLQCANITILERRLCQRAYPGMVSPNMICAGVWTGGTGSCQGDSGGPLICDGVLHGVVSGGSDPCGKPRRPAIYTSICRYRKWIRRTMEKN